MKKIALLFSCAVMMMLHLNAQMPATSPLEDGDIEKFIKTYEPLTADLEKLGEDFNKINDYNALQVIAANQEVQTVFKKYGWSDQWLGKWMTITIAYGLVKMDEELAKMPAEQRAQYEQYMSASSAQLKAMVTEKDIESVKGKVSELNNLFDN